MVDKTLRGLKCLSEAVTHEKSLTWVGMMLAAVLVFIRL